MRLARIGSLDIQNESCARIDFVGVDRSRSFYEDRAIGIDQSCNEAVDISLCEWFTPCDLDQTTGIGEYLADEGVNRSWQSLSKCIFGIAVATTERTATQSDEDARLPNPCGFALNREEYFVDSKCRHGATSGASVDKKVAATSQ